MGALFPPQSDERSPTPERTGSTSDHLAPRPHRHPWWSWGLPLLSLLLAVLVPVFVLYAYHAILASTDGELQEAITDPSAPGYETLVVSTPSHLLFGTDENGTLTMVAVMGLASNDEGGLMLLLPPETELADGRRLADVYADDGSDGARLAVARLIEANVDAISVLDPTAWAQFTAPTAPIEFTIADDLVTERGDGTTVVSFPAGKSSIPAQEIGDVLDWVNPGEDPYNRLLRQRQFLTAWVQAIADAGRGPDVVPGEVDSGLGRMLRGLANGVYRVELAPVESTATTPDGDPVLAPDVDGIHEIALEMLPFPLPAEPGARARVRLLDGVGGLDVANRFSTALVSAGAQIVVIGNAGEFGVLETEIIYHDPSFEATAQAFAEAIGAGKLTYEASVDAVLDITVLIGADQGLVTG